MASAGLGGRFSFCARRGLGLSFIHCDVHVLGHIAHRAVRTDGIGMKKPRRVPGLVDSMLSPGLEADGLDALAVFAADDFCTRGSKTNRYTHHDDDPPANRRYSIHAREAAGP